MECTETSLNHLMSYVTENKAAAYFAVSKNHVLTDIMLELLVHIYKKKSPGHILNINALCNWERSLKAQCVILKTHDIFNPGLTLKQS